MTTMKAKTLMLAAGLTLAAGMGAAEAGTLENLERERAMLVATFLDPALEPQDRQTKVQSATVRLIDLERMVLRDEALTGRNTPTVRTAFANYDLTFLAHSSAENGTTVIDAWLNQVGVTTEAIGAARVGRR
jgi:hypothetical protein